MSRMQNTPSSTNPDAAPESSATAIQLPRNRQFPVELEAEFAEMQAAQYQDNSTLAVLAAALVFHVLLIAARILLNLPASVFVLRGLPVTSWMILCLILPLAWKRMGRGRAILGFLAPAMVAAFLAAYSPAFSHQLLFLQTAIGALVLIFGLVAQFPLPWAIGVSVIAFLTNAACLFSGPAIKTVGFSVSVESLWAPAFACISLISVASLRHRDAQREFLMLRHAVFSEPVAASAPIEQAGHIDQATGVPNRVAFEMRFRAAWDNAATRRSSVALLFFWIDDLQTHKRDQGFRFVEQIQRQLGVLLKDSLRRSDDMVARFDHQHFVVMLPGVGTDGATQIAERLRGCVEEMPIFSGSQRQRVSVTVGAASLRAKRSVPREKLIDAAIHALDQARSTGSNVVCVEGRGCIAKMN